MPYFTFATAPLTFSTVALTAETHLKLEVIRK